ncbi:phospho-sugar mutase [Clostridiales Family XIII bacterium RF-744-FAT-WT-3]|uniref:phosphoglucomutase (alpha-D-glucose-1,6-bisphosphate-dependent) n=1 Tax=Baileyella intestinalis TaxID=2606709 RepID=A0A6A8M9D3_9FIRM|nr:phospho-sugar mutase [Baileyella intestinalis]MST69340.1 phospho-sugar mutase [Baileyella intestinalis]
MNYKDEYLKWMNSPVVDEDTKAELKAIENDENQLKLRFSGMMSFGTAGLREVMRAGLNGMNIYTVRYATQGLADLINSCGEDVGSGVTISYDSRHNSCEYARQSAAVLAANGIHVNIFDELRPTPELSFALRYTGSIAGINITASHNTKEYNGYKVYWSDGAQLPPEHAAQVSASMERNDIFDDVKTMDFEEGVEKGLITLIGSEIDEKYLEKVMEQSVGSRYVEQAAGDFTIIYTPFHGTGYKLVPEVLKRLGMKHVLTVPEQMVIDGDFPTVKSPNPEYIEGFAKAIEMARENDVDLIIGTDPDGDRCGVVVRNGDDYETLTGNQIGVLLLDYLITARREQGTLAPNSAAVKSIVSTTMANAICEANGIKLFETLTGFKYIGEKIKEFLETGQYTFLFGFEESNGYLAGTYARDKDAVVASMLIAEMGCMYRTKGISLYQGIQALYEKYGFFKEGVTSASFSGLEAKAKMNSIMEGLRNDPPEKLGLKVERIRDYSTGKILNVKDGSTGETGLPESNVLFYDLEGGCSLIIRPSGTEPKIKLYVMTRGQSEKEAQELYDLVKAAGMEKLGTGQK